MTDEKKLELIAEIMDVDVDDLSVDAELESFEEWDSVAILAFIAMMDEEFEKEVRGVEIRSKKTVAELMEMMEN